MGMTTMTAKTLLLAAGLLAPTAGAAALAQTAAAPAQPAVAPPAAPESATQRAAEQRIQTLKAQLGITPEQAPLWDAFAQAMRENATSTDALFQRRVSTVSTMNAVDNMKSYAEIAQDYATNTTKLATAFESLYASLSETQKQAADTLFRQQAVAAAQRHR